MSEIQSAVLWCVLLFVGMVVCSRLGERLGRPSRGENPPVNPATGAVLGLLGLLLAFTYSGATERFNRRREMMAAEVNAVATVNQRIDLLLADAGQRIRERLHAYTRSRIAVYYASGGDELARTYDESNRIQDELWRETMDAVPDSSPARALVVAGMGEMFDRRRARRSATLDHHPRLMVMTMFAVALASAGLAGYSSTGPVTRHRVQTFAFALVVSFSIYIILDLDQPRYGLIRLDHLNRLMEDQLRSIEQAGSATSGR